MEYSGANNIETLYIHGKLEESKTILGVNDAEQLSNEELRDSEEMLVSLCKLKINEFHGENIQNKAEKLLINSRIVCIFGMSLGETDKHWWQYIVNGLEKGYIKRIIIFHYDHQLDINNDVMLFRTIKKVRNELLSYSSISEDSKRDLEKRIKVICNSNIFNFKLLFKDDSKVQEIEEKAQIIESTN